MNVTELSICNLNVRGIQGKIKCKKLFKFLKSLKKDIYKLQETHLCEADEVPVNLQWQDSCVYAHGTTNSRGVAVLFNTPVDYKAVYTDPEGRSIILEIIAKTVQLTLCCIYAPNHDDPAYFEQLINCTNINL